MKIALAQFNPTIGDFAGNSARILKLAEQAQARGAKLAVFSELCLCGYLPLDLLERPAFIDRNLKELKALAGKVPLPAIVGYAGRVKNGSGKSIANKAALLCGGRIVFEQSEMLRSIAMTHKRPVIYVNQVGGDDSLIFDGASMAVTADGKVAAQALAFEEDLVLFDTETGEGEFHPQPPEEIEYAYRALIVGTRDYVSKCGFKKVLVGLSGGIDSAVVASIAVDALGAENVQGVSMPGPFSSHGSKQDAQALARNLGIELITIPISDVFDSYRKALAPAFGTRAPDVAEENIQARIRGNYLMALSNKFGSMLLSTGNKSELAVGYCTLYGDMAGGLAVISDVPKLMVYELANWINRERELIPLSTIEKAPSAELRPDQKDEDSLPPYDVLDRILKAYIEDLRSPQEIADKYGFDLKLVRDIALLVDRNEYKRKQAAPGLKITSRAFGFGRPFPIAQRFVP